MTALEDLFKSLYFPLRAYAFRFICNKEMAEDIVQDVFFELWSRRDTIRLEDKNAVKSYLFKSAYNRSINLLKSGVLYNNAPLEETNETQIIDSYLSQHLRNQEHSLLLKELEDEIAGYVESLPPQCKNIFLMSRTYGLKNKEIAEQLGISVKAVEKQISKAISGLREHLDKKDLLFLCWLFSIYF
ncbi:RNA polymerase sigma-70 factor [Parabacteroides sp. PFB2-10]|uniref:RNA polymerase sigma-70 factor n=1 Tax=Parabacteroides sp. PFB2-10 TaxID=1742405 RepID=UPI002474171B|nr:RNA polymerase sigma-70 factor [Parabacteroides sp. PFB2-10]